MKRLKALVYSIVAICAVGVLLSAGQLRDVFGEMFLLLALFLAVVELVPQYIVGEERKQTQDANEHQGLS